MTAMEREEKEKVKKREKKLEDEEILQQATWVKYTFPIKHQVKGPSAHQVCMLVLHLNVGSSNFFPTVSKGLEAEGRGIPSDRIWGLVLG